MVFFEAPFISGDKSERSSREGNIFSIKTLKESRLRKALFLLREGLTPCCGGGVFDSSALEARRGFCCLLCHKRKNRKGFSM
jgi:hypothetical protein